MNQASESIGQRLKAERERKGLSAEKAAGDLHFDVSVIEALESGDFARLGPSVYGKGHLKRYAGYLGLPVAEMLEAFDHRPAAPAAAASAAPAATLRMRAVAPAGNEPPWIPAAGLGAAVLLVAAVLWWKPWHPQKAPAPGATVASAETAASVAAVGQLPQPAESAVARDGAAADAATATAETRTRSDTEPSAGLGRARLRLSFSADSWVDVHDATGVRVFAGKGRANSVKTIAGAAPMRVYIGFASGVQLEVNNHAVAIGPQFVAGDVARFEAGADGVLRRDTHARDVSARNPQPRT